MQMRFAIIREEFTPCGFHEGTIARRDTLADACAMAEQRQNADPDALFCVQDTETGVTVYATENAPVIWQ